MFSGVSFSYLYLLKVETDHYYSNRLNHWKRLMQKKYPKNVYKGTEETFCS